MAYQAMDWHEGEVAMHNLVKDPGKDNPTSPFLTPFAASVLLSSPLLAVGTLDSSGRPWTSLWGGESGFSRAVSQSVIGVKVPVDRRFDPVATILFGEDADGEVVHSRGPGRMLGGLAINLQARRRVKLFGRFAAGALAPTIDGAGELQMAVKIEQSLGNCPKYLNRKEIRPQIPNASLESTFLPLAEGACDLILRSDLFFVSSSHHETDMDTNHRGGPEGFVRVLSNTKDDCSIVWPEYSGNRLYQTLGNLQTTPKAGLIFPDFKTGDVLYMTGKTEILFGHQASEVLSRCNLAVKLQIEEAKFVRNGLAFSATEGEMSPYNPPVRYLKKEQSHGLAEHDDSLEVRMLSRTMLTPTIARFEFGIIDPRKSSRWKPGQYVALSFEKELDIGYSHMRDDDPSSLNDDFMRTFTVSSPPGDLSGYDQFEITVRRFGPVTSKMFQHNLRTELEIELKGFGGDFYFQQGAEDNIGFIAGGIGITPLIAQAYVLDLTRLRLFWTVRGEDLGLVTDTFERIPALKFVTRLYVTGEIGTQIKGSISKLQAQGAMVEARRLMADDLKGDKDFLIRRWYTCTGTSLRTTILEWLKGEDLSYEDFSY